MSDNEVLSLHIVVDKDGATHTSINGGKKVSFKEIVAGLKACILELERQISESEYCQFHEGL